MLQLRFLAFCLPLLLLACEQQSPQARPYVPIFSRDENLKTPFLLYHFRPPMGWSRVDSGAPASSDTTEPLAHYRLVNQGRQVDLTLYNFPFDPIDQSIPPQAQVQRWKNQLDLVEESQIEIVPQAFGGFVGLRFEATGRRQGEPFAVLGWAMQLAPAYLTALEMLDTPLKAGETRQRHADFTIKAYGDPELLKSERHAIIESARTFGLIDELPSPL